MVADLEGAPIFCFETNTPVLSALKLVLSVLDTIAFRVMSST